MQLTTLFVTALLSSLTLASPDPASPQQTSAYSSAYSSYVSVLATETAFLSYVSIYDNNPSISSRVSSFDASMDTLLSKHQTPTSGYIEALPTEVQSVLASAFSVQYGLMSENGLLATSTSGAQPTGRNGGMKAAAAGLGAVAGAALIL